MATCAQERRRIEKENENRKEGVNRGRVNGDRPKRKPLGGASYTNNTLCHDGDPGHPARRVEMLCTEPLSVIFNLLIAASGQ